MCLSRAEDEYYICKSYMARSWLDMSTNAGMWDVSGPRRNNLKAFQEDMRDGGTVYYQNHLAGLNTTRTPLLLEDHKYHQQMITLLLLSYVL
jgi:hypothetical protein